MGESSLPRRDGVGVCTEAARGNAAMRFSAGFAYLCAWGVCGEDAVHRLAAGGIAGRQAARNAVRCAVAMPVRCLVCSVPPRCVRYGVRRPHRPLWHRA